MPEGVLLLLAQLASLAGMCWFALAKLPHWQQVTGATTQSTATRNALRALGGLALGVSLYLCLLADHVSMSFLVWTMTLAAGALAVALLLAWRPRWMAPFTLGIGGGDRAKRPNSALSH
jgi:hypothetical protein